MLHVTLMLGVLLAAALLAGGLGDVLRLPKVTSYLLVGVLLGPWGLHLITGDPAAADAPPTGLSVTVAQIEPLTELAIALVLFNLGCHFPFARARRISRRVMRLSLGELGLTFVLVAVGLFLLGESWARVLLLGALALATAPATTILVLKESESEGPLTEYTNALVAVNNLACIVLFELLLLAIHFVRDGLSGFVLLGQLGLLVGDLLGSLLLGVGAGLIVSYCYGLVADARRIVLLIAVAMLLLGTCQASGVPYLVTFLAMGVTVANTSYHTRQVLAELDRLTGLLCVVFFVTHGAELDIGALRTVGVIGAGYIVFRLSGKYFGIFLAARASGEEPVVCRWLGTSLMAQAGVAIALSAMAAARDPELCKPVQTIVLGTVVFFEIVGPLLIRQSVLRAGEVPLAHAIHHSGTDPLDQLRTVWNRLLIALGYNPWKNRCAADLTVKELMRKNVKAVSQSATFDEVVAYIEHSRDNAYPVINSSGHLMGVIRYRELTGALFDRGVGQLVRAADMTTPAGRVLYPDDSAARAYDLFQVSKDDCIAVVTRETPQQLLGIVRRRDVLRMLIRGQINGLE